MICALKRALRKEPYEILTANSAEEALRLLEKKPVDVVVSDEQMPGMSGSDFIAVVRRKYPDTVQMLLTGHASLEVAVRAINVGEVYRFFTKPFDPVDLAVSIHQALRHKDLIVQSRRLLRKVRSQAAVLRELESSNPGITQVRRDADGSIVVDETREDLEGLIRSMRAAAD